MPFISFILCILSNSREPRADSREPLLSHSIPPMKLLFILLIGIAIGYGYGFSDAQTHTKNVVSRLVDQAGGSNRDRYNNDVDARMERATH